MTKSYGNHEKKVHRPCSSCISSVGNLTGTPLSSPCQLRLGVDLSHYSLRPYNYLYYSYSGCTTISPWSHILLEHSMIT